MSFLRRAFFLLAAGVATVSSLPAADATIRHRVQPGDTVPRLSWQYKVRADSIRAANGLTGDALTPGATILIPGDAEPPPPARLARPPQSRETTGAQDLRPRVKPAQAAPLRAAERGPREEAQALPTPFVQDLGARSTRGELRPRTAARVPPSAPAESANNPRDEPPIDEMGRPPATTPRPTTGKVPAMVAPARADGPVMSDRRNANFLALSRQLATKGIPYNGSWTPPGESVSWVMDCSNTARWLYREGTGLELPRTASEQYLALDRTRLLWPAPHEFLSSRINSDKLGRRLKSGDLLFWENTYKPVRRPDITHVMLYLGTDAKGRWLMAGSQQSAGVNVYVFDPTAKKGGYKTFFGLFKHEGRFVAYGRPLGSG